MVVGFVDDSKDSRSSIRGHVENLGTLNDLNEIVSQRQVDEVLVAVGDVPYLELIRTVEACLRTGKVVRVYSNLLQIIAEKLNVEFYGDIPVVKLSQYALWDNVWMMKRVLDVLVSAVSLVLLAPVFAAIALGIKLSSRGPVDF